jgi:hypothetical protein
MQRFHPCAGDPAGAPPALLAALVVVGPAWGVRSTWRSRPTYEGERAFTNHRRYVESENVRRHAKKPGSDWINNPQFVEASAKNKGKFDIDKNGTVVDKATGKRPAIIIGLPFPDIDKNDPKAGNKAVWNWFYALYWEGSFHTNSPVNWVSRDGVLRRIATEVHFKYYDGNPPEFQKQIGVNPLNVLSKTVGLVKEPADVNGIVNLNWRFREGDKQDQAWTYVRYAARAADQSGEPLGRLLGPTSRSMTDRTSTASPRTSPSSWPARAPSGALRQAGAGERLADQEDRGPAPDLRRIDSSGGRLAARDPHVPADPVGVLGDAQGCREVPGVAKGGAPSGQKRRSSGRWCRVRCGSSRRCRRTRTTSTASR